MSGSSYDFPYHEKDPKSIECYGKEMIGKTFQDIFDEHNEFALAEDRDAFLDNSYVKSHKKKDYKGGLGNLVEECHFRYKANSDSHADFPDAGVELKVTPYKKDSKGLYKAKERLILTMIDYINIVKEKSFHESHVWKKCHLMLLVWYLYEKNKDKMDYKINFVNLFTPTEEDQKIMEEDYNKILAKIRAGKAHELSEGDTLYLGAATKAANSTIRRKQPFSDVPAKPRAFSLKNSYMTYVLNNFFINRKCAAESITKGQAVSHFEQYIIDKITAYKGLSVKELCEKFDLNPKAKNCESAIAFRILGVKGNRAEEFEKANIIVKAIRLEKNGTIKQSMSFPTFKFKELAKEIWDDSTFGNYLRETRFFFVVYQDTEDKGFVLKGCQFWNIPYDDLEGNVREVWQETHDMIARGLKFEYKDGTYTSELPKQKDNPVAHVRPHGRNNSDTYELPDGRQFPKQCFWLNRKYILSQLDEKLKK